MRVVLRLMLCFVSHLRYKDKRHNRPPRFFACYVSELAFLEPNGHWPFHLSNGNSRLHCCTLADRPTFCLMTITVAQLLEGANVLELNRQPIKTGVESGKEERNRLAVKHAPRKL